MRESPGDTLASAEGAIPPRNLSGTKDRVEQATLERIRDRGGGDHVIVQP